MFGPRGFLSNYPPDVVYVVNGQPITRADILRSKQQRQISCLANKRRSYNSIIKPAFIWVFDNGPIIPYGGDWLYVRTLKQDWQIRDAELRLQIMALFPCGLLRMIENYKLWKQAFILHYRRPNCKRPQGLATCWVEISSNGTLMRVI